MTIGEQLQSYRPAQSYASCSEMPYSTESFLHTILDLTLFYRQVISHLAVVLVMFITIILFYIGYKGEFVESKGELSKRVENIASFFAAEFREDRQIDDRLWQLAMVASGANLWVEDEAGQVLQGVATVQRGENAYNLRRSPDGSKSQVVFLPDGQSALVMSEPVLIGDKKAMLMGYFFFDNIGLVLQRIIRFYFWPTIVGGGAAVLFGMFLSHNLTHSIADIAAAAKRFSAGDYASRTRTSGEDEIGALGNTFNAMAESIAQTHRTRREFFANISHELKTPITCIKATAEALVDGIGEDETSRDHYLQRILAETDRMARLVADIMDMEQLESGKLLIRQEKFDIARLLRKLEDKWSSLLWENKLTLLLSLRIEHCYLLGDEGRMEQVLDNLLSNAIRCSPIGATITLQLRATENQLQVLVIDEGEGIAEADLPLIWDRFYRTDKSRVRTGGGNGLGLTISRSLIHAMGGEIEAFSQKGAGATFIITMPRIE